VTEDNDLARYFAANCARWDESVAIHAASRGYDLDGFLRREKTLYSIEMDEVGNVAGKTLLHLQCHFGMDTLNWARLGDSVTGLDFSEAAIRQARTLASQIGVRDATFIQSNLYDARDVIDRQFDIVYTGIGALNWLPDIRGWARVAASFVNPGGFLYLYECHPALWALDDEREDRQLVATRPYFETVQPKEWNEEATYVDGPPLKNTTSFEWNHGIGEIVTALIDAGLGLEFLHEHREIAWQALPWMVPTSPIPAGSRHVRRGGWTLPPEQRDLVPLMYSIKATRAR